MKLELLVIVYQHDTVNSEPDLVHTARHAMEAGFVLHIWSSLKQEEKKLSISLNLFFLLFRLMNRISMQDGQLGRSRNTVAVGEPVAGLKRDCSLPGKIIVLHALEVGSSPACSIKVIDRIKVIRVLAKLEMRVRFLLYTFL